MVVESETSSSSDSESSSMTVSSDSLESESSSDSSSSSQDDDDRSTATSTMSDPEFERYLFRIHGSPMSSSTGGGQIPSESGDTFDSRQLDPALGYIPSSRPVFERDVSRLVMRKRKAISDRMSIQRQRTLSDSVLTNRSSEDRARNQQDDGLSRDEVQRRVEAALDACRRGRSDAALRRLATSGDDDDAVQGGRGDRPPAFRLSSPSSDGSDDSSGSNEDRRGKRTKPIDKGDTADENDDSAGPSNGETFRKRRKLSPIKEAGTSESSSPEKKQQYRRRVRSSSSESDSGSEV